MPSREKGGRIDTWVWIVIAVVAVAVIALILWELPARVRSDSRRSVLRPSSSAARPKRRRSVPSIVHPSRTSSRSAPASSARKLRSPLAGPTRSTRTSTTREGLAETSLDRRDGTVVLRQGRGEPSYRL
jgi:hypothetical protein